MVSYSQNYKTVISDKITFWEGEQFPLRIQWTTYTYESIKSRIWRGLQLFVCYQIVADVSFFASSLSALI